MQFVYPGFLFALTALAIPVIIHLFNFRRYKKIDFTNVSLLKEIDVTTRSVKKLKNLLVLLTRLLAITFLVLAFARPYIPADNQETNSPTDKTVIYIDNSLSMSRISGSQDLLQTAVDASLSFLNNDPVGLEYYLMTNDFRQAEFNALGRSEVLAEIEKIKISGKTRSLESILNRVREIRKDETGFRVLMFSDFQRNQFESGLKNIDSSMNLTLVRVESENNANVSIDSCWLQYPAATVSEGDSLTVALTNGTSELIADLPLRLYLNGKQVHLQNISLEPNQRKEINLALDIRGFGEFNGWLEIQDGLAEFDNRLYITISNDSSKQIYLLGSDFSRLNFEALFQSPLKFRYDAESNADISYLNAASTIFIQFPASLSTGLISTISERVSSGANLVLIPSDPDDINQMNQVLDALKLEQFSGSDTTNQQIASLNTESQFFKGTVDKMPENPDMPEVTNTMSISERSKLIREDILSFESGKVALRSYTVNKGKVFLFCFGLDREQSGFAKHSLFVPVMLNMVLTSGVQFPLYHLSGLQSSIPVSGNRKSAEVFRITGNGIDVIPEIAYRSGDVFLQIRDQITEAGVYSIHSGAEAQGNFSLNYIRSESEFDFYDEGELNSESTRGSANSRVVSGGGNQLSEALTSAGKPVELWKYCLILALLFFLSEVLILKLFKS